MVTPRTIRRTRGSLPLRESDWPLAGPGRRATGCQTRQHAPALVPVRSASPRREPTRPLRVLVVDDEPSIRMLCRVNLEVAGVEVREAADGEAALAAAASERPDVVLLDVMMPRLDGWEVARRLQADEATRDVPIVFLSALAAGPDRRQGYEVGAVGYICKPFDPLALAETLQWTCDRVAAGEREQLRRELLAGT